MLFHPSRKAGRCKAATDITDVQHVIGQTRKFPSRPIGFHCRHLACGKAPQTLERTVELAQLRERLAQIEQTATRQAADLAKIEAGAAELRAELATTRQAKDEAAAAAVRTMEQLLTAQTERSAEAQRHTQEAANLRIAVEAGNARLEAAAREAEAAREQIKELRAEAKAAASAQSQSKAK